MNRNEVKTKYLYAIIACLVAVICLIPAVSAFFTDHAVLSAQIKTGTWNYSLAIDPKGGTWNGTTSATLMENLEAGQTVAIADPVRTGYTFTNWTLSTGSAGKFDSAKKIYTAAPGSKDTLGANWRANTYKIAFNGNGADGGSMPAQSLTYDAKSALSANAFTRTGYSFSGWNTSADGEGTAYADGASVNNLSADDGAVVTLYAQWKAHTITISVDANGGEAYVMAGRTNPYTLTYGDTTLPSGEALSQYGLYDTQAFATPPEGYITTNTFAIGSSSGKTISGNTGFDTAQALASALGYPIADQSQAVTLYAQWSAITYHIAYDLNGGTMTDQPTSYTVESANITLPTPTRTGYTFTGWTGSNGTTAQKSVTIAKGSTGNKAYTANWAVNKYTVTCEDWVVDASNNRKIKLGASTKQMGYGATVSGTAWGDDGSRHVYYKGYAYKSATTATVGVSGATVYRYFWMWTNINILDANGAETGNVATFSMSSDGGKTWLTGLKNEYTHSADDTVKPYGTTYIIKDLVPVHDYEEYDRCTNATYSNGQWTFTPTVGDPNITKETGVNIMMKYKTYTLTYNLNGGSVSGNPTSYNYSTASFTLKNPTRTGYTFTGWTGSNGTTAQTAVTIATGSTGNKNYVANWKANTNTKYTVVHQQEQLDGTYKTVETQNLTGTTNAKVTPAVKSYTGFKAPAAQTITITANGTASVTYKYMRNSYTVTRQYRLENADGSFSAYTRIDSKSYKYGATVAAWSRAADTTYKAASIGAYTVGAKNDTLSVNVMRNTSANNVIRYRLQNADGSYPSTYTTGWSGTLRYGQSHTWSLAQSTSHAAASKTVAYNGGTVSVDVPRRTGRLVINANGGSFSGSTSRTTSVIRYGSTGDNISPMPTRTGYTLNGLYTAASGGTKVVNADGTKANDGTYSKNGAWQLNSDVTVYAQWTANKYTVTLSKGQGIDSVSGAGTYTYGQTVTINATVNANYNWSQWNVLSGTVSGTLTNQKLTFTMPAGNVSLRAGDASGNEAHRKTYVITYHANLHDGQKLQDSDGTGSTDTHISSIPSGAVKGTSGGTEVYQQTILSGGGSKVLGNGFSWTAVKAAAAKVMSTLFDTNWDE